MTIKLGDKVKDNITGYSGTLTIIANHIHGHRRFAIQAKIDRNGKMPEVAYFDEPRIELDNGKESVGFIKED